jgi:hypothetical protein
MSSQSAFFLSEPSWVFKKTFIFHIKKPGSRKQGSFGENLEGQSDIGLLLEEVAWNLN